MIPEITQLESLDPYRHPSKTYKLDIDKNRIYGYTDGLDAIRQAIYKILQTERYAYLIYSWNYGSELERFIGQDLDYVRAAIEGEIKESLYMDDRIRDISDFHVNQVGTDSCLVSFVVDSDHGRTRIEREVAYDRGTP